MHRLKYFIIGFLAFLSILAVGIYLYLNNTKPTYSGEITLDGLNNKVNVYYDDYGIPHIYAQNEEDAYYALGYLYAQDRLYQTDLIKRIASGRLSEVLGEKVLYIDKYMRTLGLAEAGKKSAEKYLSSSEFQYQKSFNAYLKGFNYFVKNGKLPIEYKILGLPREELKPEDSYAILNFIALGFSFSVHQEAITTYIYDKYGEDYVKDLYFGEKPIDYILNKNIDTALIEREIGINNKILSTFEKLNLNIWEGSNAWVISPKKSKSGKVLFANDTHFALTQPSAWYEAEINYPGYNFYGFHLPGQPFPIVGHSMDFAWGLTIFPVDNSNYYLEELDTINKKVKYKGEWTDLDIKKEKIAIKDAESVDFEIWKTPHGPIVNKNDTIFGKNFENHISLWWAMNHLESEIIQCSYNLSRSKNIDDFEDELAKIDVLGLNVMYGDSDDNIAYWACGKIPFYNDSINPFALLDGANGTMEVDSFYPFSSNPHNKNPKKGFVATANNDPVLSDAKYYPGHYLPNNRIKIINDEISKKDNWTVEDMKKLQLSQVSVVDKQLKDLILSQISDKKEITDSKYLSECSKILSDWDGVYNADSKAPIIFHKLIYYTVLNTMSDELSQSMFTYLLKSYLLKGSIERLFNNPKSPWWDDIKTKEVKENRSDIFLKSFVEACEKIEDEWGEDTDKWRWENAHQLDIPHPFSVKKPLDKVFNVGTYKMPSSSECLGNMGFHISNDKIHKIEVGAALRVLIDFADVENSINVIPTGQSGNIMSKYYDDQIELYTKGQYRKMIMNDPNIVKVKNKLILKK